MFLYEKNNTLCWVMEGCQQPSVNPDIVIKKEDNKAVITLSGKKLININKETK